LKQVIIFFLIVITVLIGLIGCSEKDNSSTTPSKIFAYNLEQFVSVDSIIVLINENDQAEDVPFRNMFSIHVLASDGWSWRSKGLRDLSWKEFQKGYIIPEDKGRLYFTDYVNQGVNTYNVKYAQTIDIFRAIEVVKPNGNSAIYELNALNTESINNYDGQTEMAIKLQNLIPENEITSIDSIQFIAADEYSKTYSPEEFNDCYWLFETQRTIFPNFPDMPNSKKKFKFLQMIIVFGTQQDIEEPFVCNFSENPDLTFEFPDNYDDFVHIIWNP